MSSSNNKKKVGIAADNYKLDRFKKKLSESGFNDITVTPMGMDVSLININEVDSDRVIEVQRICTDVELHFKRSN